MQACNNAYVSWLKDKRLGYAKVTMLDLILHICDRYVQIKSKKIKKNKTKIVKEYTSEKPIDILFKQINNIITFNKAGNDTMSDKRILHIAMKLSTKTPNS